MKANNFNVMKGPGGVYWMESMESKKKYTLLTVFLK
jgi:hypothetical protein